MTTIDRKEIIRALLLVADTPLSEKKIEQILSDDARVTQFDIRQALHALKQEMAETSLELVEVASGFRLQIRKELAPWVSRLWEERPQKYSRALLETLALICYRQPLTRGDIEEIRGVSLSGGILKTLFEREWVREVGHREAPGRPALLATTRQFLDDMNLRSLDQLPPLPELADPEKLEAALVRLVPADHGEKLGLGASPLILPSQEATESNDEKIPMGAEQPPQQSNQADDGASDPQH